jgi:hypothetical protein
MAVVVCAGSAAPTDAASQVGLGSRVLANEIHATGIGRAHPRKFDIGQFPIFDRLHWMHWGAATALGSGVNPPDGGPGLPHAQVLAYSRGTCDGQTVYRRIKARVRSGAHWGAWRALSPLGAGAASRGMFCLDAAVAHCTADDGTRLTAYNVPCASAVHLWAGPLPAGWTGANGDDSRGGHAWLFREADSDRVTGAANPDGTLRFAALGGAPLVYAQVAYGD